MPSRRYCTRSRPLRFSTATADASTVGKLKLTLRPSPDVLTSKYKPHNWSCTIQSHILVKTFFSVSRLDCVPGNYHIDAHSDVQSRTHTLELASRTLNLIGWDTAAAENIEMKKRVIGGSRAPKIMEGERRAQ